MDKNAKIYVAGHNGLVGSALVRNLQANGYSNLLLRRHAELDLTDQHATEAFFAEEKPEYVFLAAAKVGGIHANNSYPAEFIRQNLVIQTNVIHAAYKTNVQRLLFLGSSCIYPRNCPQPIKEEYLLSGPLELTNRAYAVAKIAGIETCRSYNKQFGSKFLSVMPTNLYGPNDNYDLDNSHVLPALIRKFHTAKISGSSEVEIWGSGNPRREFLYVDDMASACIFLAKLSAQAYQELLNYSVVPGLINVGYGSDLSIQNLAEKIAKVVGFTGRIIKDQNKPDGTPQKLLDSSRIHELGWKPEFSLDEGISKTYSAYTTGIDLT
ncbi:GDP-L-fucose synthase [Methylomonas sp. AM2-LC]|uniref:GDP-L-fucose synthase family protein n=1 Tax=Methylomonas sp. AM2-LC TaxID=3153301 RepID=UPI0032671D59